MPAPDTSVACRPPSSTGYGIREAACPLRDRRVLHPPSSAWGRTPARYLASAFRRPWRRGSRFPSDVSFVTIPPAGEPAVDRDEGVRAKVSTTPKSLATARND